MKKIKKIIMVVVPLVLLAAIILSSSLLNNIYPDISYNKFTDMVENKKIQTVTYSDNDEKILLETDKDKKYTVLNPKTEDFREFLLKNDVKIYRPTTFNWQIFLTILQIVLFGTFIVFMVKSLSKSLPSTSMSNHKVEKLPDVTLNDIACNNEIKKEVLRIIDFLKNPERYEEKKAKFPSDILFYGPPGTGKTLLAKALANEAGCNFYAMSGSDFVEMYVGRGASRVRELFKEAKKNTPAIIFIDEIDSLGKSRGKDQNQEAEHTINALLHEMDGFSTKDKVVIIGATNRLEDLDPALTRSGRFGKHIRIPLPMTKEERKKIINIHKIEDAYDETVDFDHFATITRGCSGADISSILNEALLISISEGKEKVSKQDLEKAFNQHLFEGHQESRKGAMAEDEQKLVAYHESGHAIVAKLLCQETVSIISIIGTTTGAGGYTISMPDNDKFFENRSNLENRIMMLYAGRAAEEIAGYDKTTGASSDIQKATQILKNLVYSYGMYDYLIDYNILQDKIKEKTEAIEQLSQELYDRTKQFLLKNIDLLNITASILLENETIEEPEFIEIVNNVENYKEKLTNKEVAE